MRFEVEARSTVRAGRQRSAGAGPAPTCARNTAALQPAPAALTFI